MFESLLIANRGEIACRVIRTARRMGLRCIAVYSDADADALHVEMADEAVRIGPAEATRSYLDGAAIVAAARATGAQAIHPGYGFLSENPEFVEAVVAAGLVFVGPSAAAIRAMGLKDRAKALMAEAGVPVVPGYHGRDQDDALLAAQAEAIGWPVLIKAVAGGGGKGMRRVDRAGDFADALAGARREARQAFGNADVLIEKFVARPRHIEIQVVGDGSRALHLWERDCSMQRRHQKVIEEAPAPGMTDAVRAAMGAAAVRAAEAIGYAGAGTVEFIADGSGPLREDGFWFMEMNTRLQVEHPVTEAVTGIDLVEWQLRIAAGEALTARQDGIRARGHAIEARVYAEDPANGFLPATGRLAEVDFGPGVRVDSGVRAGDEISPHYDPMIAKVIAHGADRPAAIAALRRGLAGARLAGSVTNMGFLVRLLDDADFAAGRLDTGLIDRRGAALTAEPAPEPEILALAAVALAGLPREGADGFHLWTPLRQPVRMVLDGGTITAMIRQPRPGLFEVALPQGVTELCAIEPGTPHWRWTWGDRRRAMPVTLHGAAVTLAPDGQPLTVSRADPVRAAEAADATDTLTAPMPGFVRRVAVVAEAHVEEGDPLLVLEAMKMEHTLRAPRRGSVARVDVAEGDQVARGALLITLRAEDDGDD
ncbi:ATP-grasp domain-containing protein [Rhodobacteraceae bacterium 2CG4]|uniref:ATP-grasp domain-containing protein n=1 Tax=Halovulum marinum TaxID=2662447 RepID=A0A6L5YVS3_9RHOB|nr:biotin carboxylase N-terminal domain-containing protein [Halovulum marinum]MSU88337.1 ATP-grasp domain-containing protein [Halovulum marinum]